MTAPRLDIDHLILLARDLDEAHRWMADSHGLTSVVGGHHQGHGTANRIVPLGEEYIEIMAVVDPEEAEQSPMGRWALAVGSHPPTLAALCIRTDDAEAIAARLGLDPIPMSRQRPDGTTISWRLVAVERTFSGEAPVFFIEWHGDPSLHPGRMEAVHDTQPTGPLRVTLSGDPDEIEQSLGAHSLPIEVVAGPPGIIRAVLPADAGDVVFAEKLIADS